MFENDGHRSILPSLITVEHMKYGESLYSHLLYKNISFNIQNYNSATCLVLGWNFISDVNPLNAQLNPIFHLLALLRAHHILHVSRIGVENKD